MYTLCNGQRYGLKLILFCVVVFVFCFCCSFSVFCLLSQVSASGKRHDKIKAIRMEYETGFATPYSPRAYIANRFAFSWYPLQWGRMKCLFLWPFPWITAYQTWNVTWPLQSVNENLCYMPCTRNRCNIFSIYYTMAIMKSNGVYFYSFNWIIC